MDEQTKKAFDFAADITKQLITVAAAIVTLTVTFSKDTPAEARSLAFRAWCAFAVSIFFGFLSLMSLTAELQPKPTGTTAAAGNPAPSIWKKNIIIFSTLQMLAFLIAVALSAYFGKIAMGSVEKPASPPAQVCNCVLPAQPSPAPVPRVAPPTPALKHKPATVQ